MNLLSISSLSSERLKALLQLTKQLDHTNDQPLLGKNILFAFEKPSLRTKVGTEVAINQLGGNVIHISPENFFEGKVLFSDKNPHQIKGREALKDTVGNVSSWCDAIFARVFSHETLTEIEALSQIPLVNALCDKHHPMQALADMYTLYETFGDRRVTITYVGDSNNVAFSLSEAALKLGHNVRIASPRKYQFSPSDQAKLKNLEGEGTIAFYSNPIAAAFETDVIYTDTFVSMGEEDQFDEKMKAFDGYQVNKALFLHAKSDYFMHCLPAHRGIEVTDEVMDGPGALIHTQAKNRMKVSKAVFTWILSSDYEEEIMASKRERTAPIS